MCRKKKGSLWTLFLFILCCINGLLSTLSGPGIKGFTSEGKMRYEVLVSALDVQYFFESSDLLGMI